MHPFEKGSADVSSPHTAKTGVMAKMSAALPAAATSRAMSMHRRKMRTSAKDAHATFTSEPMDGLYPKTLENRERTYGYPIKCSGKLPDFLHDV
jgi:hypothetical protein